jgi:hypothetical protein
MQPGGPAVLLLMTWRHIKTHLVDAVPSENLEVLESTFQSEVVAWSG